ncbi:MAG: hypothetical protein ACOZBZ_01760 [Patescibacteria group bacterium]
MLKKVAALAGAGALLLGMVVPVLAQDGLDLAWVENSAVAISETGGRELCYR